MKLGFVIPKFPFEKRVALFPDDINDFENELIIEEGFGASVDIDDLKYEEKGCIIASRDEIFKNCDAVFCLKLLQPDDYKRLRDGQMIIGWTHPTGSGADFYQNIAIPKKLIIVDLDNIFPTIYLANKKKLIDWIPRDFVRQNSFNAGMSSTLHAFMSYGMIPNDLTKIAILSSGNTSQGAFCVASKFSSNIRMFYRKTMNEFYLSINEFDVIINGIEVDQPGQHIISAEQLAMIKTGALIIDAAADAGNAIEGTHYTTIGDPIYKEKGKYFYEVNNSPTIFYRQSSRVISKEFSKWVYKKDIKKFLDFAYSMEKVIC
jgi:N5-(carboxyethyl)ornithine synthase